MPLGKATGEQPGIRIEKRERETGVAEVQVVSARGWRAAIESTQGHITFFFSPNRVDSLAYVRISCG